MKKIEELSQRDREKLNEVKKKMACSPEFRNIILINTVRTILMGTPTDDDEQKIHLLLEKNSYYTPESKRRYKILCETVINKSDQFAKETIKKARKFAKANKIELVIPAKAPQGAKTTA